MSAYDNPTIIKDGEGVGGWVQMAQDISQTVTSVSNLFKENRQKQADIVAKKQETYNRFEGAKTLEQNKKMNENYSALESAGAKKPLLDQAKIFGGFSMEGGEQEWPPGSGSTRDFGVGSITASAKIASGMEMSKEERKGLLGVINRQKDGMANFFKEIALVKGDEKDWKDYQDNAKGSYLTGGTEAEQMTSNLVGGSLYNTGNPKVFEETKREYNREMVGDEEETTLNLQWKIKANDPLAAPYYLDSGVKGSGVSKPDKEGYITIDWKRNLSDGSWNGSIVQPQDMETEDYKAAAKKLTHTVNGKISDTFQTVIPPEVKEGQDEYSLKETSTYVNMDMFQKGMEAPVLAKANEARYLYNQGNTEGFNAYLEQLGRAGIDFTKMQKNGKLDQDLFLATLVDYEKDAMMTMSGLGQERDMVKDINGKPNSNYGKFKEQRVNNLQLTKRPITEYEVDYMEKQGMENVPEVGTEQYFYIDSSSVKKPGDTETQTKSTETERLKTDWRNVFNDVPLKGGSVRDPKLFFAGGKEIPNETGTYLKYWEQEDSNPAGYYRSKKSATGKMSKKGTHMTRKQAAQIF